MNDNDLSVNNNFAEDNSLITLYIRPQSGDPERVGGWGRVCVCVGGGGGRGFIKSARGTSIRSETRGLKAGCAVVYSP